MINRDTGIRIDSTLMLNVKDANNLKYGQYQVRARLDKAKSETQYQVGDQPIWNEAITFAVTDESQLLQIQLVEWSGAVVFEDKIDISNHT